jgi:hypothetical protein
MFASEIYVQRRKRLCEELPGGVVLLPGHNESPINYASNTYPFRQNSHFLYLAGIDSPDMFLMIDIEAGISTLYADEPDMNDLIWTGPVPSTLDLAGRPVLKRLSHFGRCFLMCGQPKQDIENYILHLPTGRVSPLTGNADWHSGQGIDPSCFTRINTGSYFIEIRKRIGRIERNGSGC